ncbi:hypothetical protein [Hymenobacter bucti]|uniref:Uncharacterized protein n=1 Tax=Hymenobacter bucti TaxID=1844114 RepID=A0ABW4QQL1_9BACT
MKQAFALVGLLAAASCNPPSEPAAAAPVGALAQAQPNAAAVRQAVAAYIRANTADFAGYEPVRWGRPTAYTKASEAASQGVVAMQLFDNALASRREALANYKASLARRDAPAKTAAFKARYGKANRYNDSLLALATKLDGAADTARLGAAVRHTYRTRARSGFMLLDSATFVVYTTGQVERL